MLNLLERINLRPVRESDSNILLKWRNDPLTRKYSFNQHKISLDEHRNWFQGVLSSDKKLLLIILKDNERVGQVRFDISDNGKEARISVTIALKWNGKGIGTLAIYKSCKHIFQQKKKLKTIIAKIKKENIRSIKAFSNAGFGKIKTSSNVVEMELYV